MQLGNFSELLRRKHLLESMVKFMMLELWFLTWDVNIILNIASAQFCNCTIANTLDLVMYIMQMEKIELPKENIDFQTFLSVLEMRKSVWETA